MSHRINIYFDIDLEEMSNFYKIQTQIKQRPINENHLFKMNENGSIISAPNYLKRPETATLKPTLSFADF